jgi:very-short-patch-repair endonuclease
MGIKKNIDLERLRILFEKDGLSVNAIAKILGVDRMTINSRLRSIGIEPPSMREAYYRNMAIGWKPNTEAAHEAVKGMKRTNIDLERRARGKQGKLSSIYETMFYEEFLRLGYSPIASLAVGKYNIDIAFADVKVAVEIDGGHWHESTEKKIISDNNKRAFLEPLGWTITRYKISKKNLSKISGYCCEVISLVERLRLNKLSV